ncbi:APC family permease [Nocardioides mangrovicus]|uniref:APC family permease n=2 Tax=Nocardioides mangrovicus TaxID=2478913 RepID=A0A3L8P9C2_9ACTN|nr:APC family permease [Nocardioides mangrovicus]
MATQTPAAPENKQGKSGASLAREIGLIGLLWASMGSIIGSGWLFGAQKGLYNAGPAVMISWVIGGVCILILALVHAELGAMFPLSGGSARFPHYAFGGIAGAGFGWFSWLQAVTVAPIEVSAAILYATHYKFAQGWLNPNETLTHSGLIVAVILMALLAAVNYLGVKALANTNSAVTWWKVGVPLGTILVVAVAGLLGAGNAGLHWSNFHAADGFNPYGLKGILLAIPVSGIIFAYLGFEQADQLAGESKNPKRDIPLAVIGSIILGLIIYILLQLMFLIALPSSAIGKHWCDGNPDNVSGCLPAEIAGKANPAIQHLFSAFSGPWAEIAALISLGWLATILYIDAIVSPLGTGLIYYAAGSRVSYGLARNDYFHSVFGKLTASKVPWVGVLVSFVAGCVCFLPFPSWQSLVGLITSASVLMYAGAPLSFGAFRKRLPDYERPYRLPLGEFWSPLAFIVSSLIILWSGWETAWKLGILIVIGILLIFNREMDPAHLNTRAAGWLPVYLIGIGVITYFSTFGGSPAQHVMGLWTSIIVTAAFSLVIYYWAIAVALPTETIQRMIDEVVVPEEDDLAGPAH